MIKEFEDALKFYRDNNDDGKLNDCLNGIINGQWKDSVKDIEMFFRNVIDIAINKNDDEIISKAKNVIASFDDPGNNNTNSKAAMIYERICDEYPSIMTIDDIIQIIRKKNSLGYNSKHYERIMHNALNYFNKYHGTCDDLDNLYDAIKSTQRDEILSTFKRDVLIKVDKELLSSKTRLVAERASSEGKKKRKKKSIFIAIITICAIALGFIIGYIPNYDTAHVDDITIEYNENYNLDKVYGQIIVDRNSFIYDSITKDITLGMIEDFDDINDKIGSHEVLVKYDDNHKALVNIIIKQQILKVPNVNRLSNILSWAPIDGAKSYAIYAVKDGEHRLIGTVDAVKNMNSNYTYDIGGVIGVDDMEVMVQAMTDDPKYANSPESDGILVTKLKPVNNIVYQDGRITWDTVNNATHYTLYINGEKIENIEKNYYPYVPVEGENKISIVANGSNSYISSTASNYVVKKLPKPTISIANKKLIMESDTDYYLDGVLFDGDLTDIKVAGRYKITAKRVSNEPDEIDSDISDGFIVTKLAAPHILMKNELLSCQYKSNVQYYMDGNIFDGNIPSTLSIGNHDITAFVSADKNDELDSELSQVLTISKLGDVANIACRDGNIVWDNVQGATEYTIVVNDVTYKVNSNSFNASLNVGPNAISVKAYGFGNVVSSNVSSRTLNKLDIPIIEVVSQQLKTEAYTQYYLNEQPFDGNLAGITKAGRYELRAQRIALNDEEVPSDMSQPFAITKLESPIITNDVYNIISQYESDVVYFLDGEQFDGVVPKSISEGTHIVKGYAISTNNHELDSMMSSDYELYKLASVKNIRYQENRIMWDEVIKASSYSVTIAGVRIDNITSNYYHTYLEEGENEIIIEPYSNTNLLPGNTVRVVFNKLAKPVIKVDNQVLFIEANTDYYINGEEFDGNLTTIKVEGSYIITAKRLSVAHGDIESDMSEPYNINKLSKPTIHVKNEKIEGFRADVTYYFDDVVMDNSNIPENITAGVHTIRAKALSMSDNSKLDSELNEFTIFKNNVPEIVYNEPTKRMGVVGDVDRFAYYLEGRAFDGNFDNKPDGLYTVTAINHGNGADVLDSDEAAPCYVTIVDLTPSFHQQDNLPKGTISIACSTVPISWDMRVEYILDGAVIDTVSFNNRKDTVVQLLLFDRMDKGIANSARISFVWHGDKGENHVKKIVEEVTINLVVKEK